MTREVPAPFVSSIRTGPVTENLRSALTVGPVPPPSRLPPRSTMHPPRLPAVSAASASHVRDLRCVISFVKGAPLTGDSYYQIYTRTRNRKFRGAMAMPEARGSKPCADVLFSAEKGIERTLAIPFEIECDESEAGRFHALRDFLHHF